MSDDTLALIQGALPGLALSQLYALAHHLNNEIVNRSGHAAMGPAFAGATPGTSPTSAAAPKSKGRGHHKGPPWYIKRIDSFDEHKKGMFALEGEFVKRSALSGIAPGQMMVFCDRSGDEQWYALLVKNGGTTFKRGTVELEGCATLATSDEKPTSTAPLPSHWKIDGALTPVALYLAHNR